MELSKTTTIFTEDCLTWSILGCYTEDSDPGNRSTWNEELEQLAQIQASVFEILASDRVRYQRYNSVYHHLSQASEILEQITMDNRREG